MNTSQDEEWWFLALNSYNDSQLPTIISQPQYSWYNLRSREPVLRSTEANVQSGGVHYYFAQLRSFQVPDAGIIPALPVLPADLALIKNIHSDWVGWSDTYQTWQWRGIRNYELISYLGIGYTVIVHSTLTYRYDQHYPYMPDNYHVGADGSASASPPYYFAYSR